MKIRTKLFLLMLGVFVLSFAVLSVHRRALISRLNHYLALQQQESTATFRKIVELRGRPLFLLARDYTYWDDMVNFVHAPDAEWAAENIEASLPSFEIDGVWIFDRSGAAVYVREGLAQLPFSLAREDIRKLFGTAGVRSFFAIEGAELWECAAATIHPTKDEGRLTAIQGGMLVARRWSADYLRELENITKTKIRVDFFFDGLESMPSATAGKGELVFSHVLEGWDGRPLANLQVTGVLEALRLFSGFLNYVFLFAFFCGFSFLAIFFYALYRTVQRPLGMLNAALQMREATVLEPLRRRSDEYGELALALEQFFRQRAELMQEVTTRSKAEADLSRAYEKLKNAQAQLIQTEKMASIGLLAGGVAHEINNPLTGVLNNIQLIKMQLKQQKNFSPSEFSEIIDVVEESALRCRKITRSLLEFSHVSTGEFLPLSLNAVVTAVTQLLVHEMKLQNTSLKEDLAAESPQIKGDVQLLKQVVFNLISNAQWAIRKCAHNKPGCVQIRTRFDEQANRVVLTVADNGIGIAPQDLEHIFEPFFTTKDVGEGTGLGLSVVYNILKLHGADIRAESVPGRETVFTVTFPAI